MWPTGTLGWILWMERCNFGSEVSSQFETDCVLDTSQTDLFQSALHYGLSRLFVPVNVGSKAMSTPDTSLISCS